LILTISTISSFFGTEGLRIIDSRTNGLGITVVGSTYCLRRKNSVCLGEVDWVGDELDAVDIRGGEDGR